MADTLDRRALLVRAAALGAATALPGWTHARTERWDKVAAVLDGYVSGRKLPGLAAAVAHGTEAPRFLTTGTLARDTRARVTPDSLFRIYSMTKPVTGIAAMILVEEGKLALDQDIAEILPAFRNPRVLVDPARDLTSRPATRPITVRNLLTHTAGLGYTIVTKGPLLAAYIREGINPAAVSRQRFPGLPAAPTAPSLAVFADRLARLPLIADPGTRWSYSIGLDLLGRVIEVAGGLPFDRFLATRIFAPLGMSSTFFRVPRSELGRMTTNYFHTPGGPIVLDRGGTTVFSDAPAFPFGGAGLVSSPRDYDRFLAMLMGEGAIGARRIMKTETARLAMSNLVPPGAEMNGMAGEGFGAGGRVTITAEPSGRGIGTFGWGGAAATIAWVDRARGVRAAGYAQFMPDQAMPFTTDFAKAVYASL